MNSANQISLAHLVLVFIPVCIVILIYIRWSLSTGTLVYAVGRMVVQLILVGYALIFLFQQSHVLVSCAVLTIMLLTSSWIALRPIKLLRRKLYGKVLFSIFLGSVPVLILVIGGVLRLDPWYKPQYLIPIAGMIFANAMNSVSLCAERFYSEIDRGQSFVEARNISFKTSLLPLINSFFAVGLVSIPGMMTGQILSGTSPLLAVRYQMMVMCMLLGASGIAAAIFLKIGTLEAIKK